MTPQKKDVIFYRQEGSRSPGDGVWPQCGKCYHVSRILVVTWVLSLLVTVCHASQGAIPPASTTTTASSRSAPPVEYSGYWQYERCENCHSHVGSLSHPVNIRPSMPMPRGFKLEDGRLACKTCHRGQKASDHAQSRRRHDNLLRGPRRGRRFCLNCHARSTMPATSVMHGMMLEKIHGKGAMPAEIPFVSPKTTASSSVKTFSRRPVTSQFCLDCHQGAGGPDIGHSHPYHVPYASKFAGLTNIRHMGLKPKSQLDPRIRLFKGKIECLSCHSPFAGKPHMLVMNNRSNQLCYACHQPH